MNKNTKFIFGLIIFIVASALGKVLVQGLMSPKAHGFSRSTTYRSNYKTTNINTEYQNYTYTSNSTKDSVKVKVHDKIGAETHEYDIKFDNDARNFINGADKEYIKQNNELILQASKAYSFIISNDYKAVEYCSHYYPINILKKQFDTRFQSKKEKAETILNNAFGENGAKNFADSFLNHSNIVQMAKEQMEDDYMTVKKLAVQDGEPDFTREQYCQMLDENADFAVEEDYKKFKILVPNF